jgi:hypothetical protein
MSNQFRTCQTYMYHKITFLKPKLKQNNSYWSGATFVKAYQLIRYVDAHREKGKVFRNLLSSIKYQNMGLFTFSNNPTYNWPISRESPSPSHTFIKCASFIRYVDSLRFIF